MAAMDRKSIIPHALFNLFRLFIHLGSSRRAGRTGIAITCNKARDMALELRSVVHHELIGDNSLQTLIFTHLH